MDLSLSDDQQQLRAAVKDAMSVLASNEVLIAQHGRETGYVERIWTQLCRAGLLALPIPDRYGGSGASLSDTAVAMEEFGRGPLPQLYVVHASLSALLLLEAGDEQQKLHWLPQLADGGVRVTVALTDRSNEWTRDGVTTSVTLSPDGARLSGEKVFVPDAAGATHALVSARVVGSQQIVLVLVDLDSDGVSAEPLEGFVSWQSRVVFDSVAIPEARVLGDPDSDAWPAIELACARAIPLLCAYQVGSCQSVFDLALEFSRTRIQFGQPVGRFQRVQDHVIELVNDLDAARWSTYETLWKLETEPERARAAVHMTKSIVSDSHWDACNWAHEVHAGLGTDLQYGLAKHTYLSRSLFHFLGEPRWHRERMAQELEWTVPT